MSGKEEENPDPNEVGSSASVNAVRRLHDMLASSIFFPSPFPLPGTMHAVQGEGELSEDADSNWAQPCSGG